MLNPLRLAASVVLASQFTSVAFAQNTSPPAPVFSIGQPPRSLIYADLLAQRSSGATRGVQLTAGFVRKWADLNETMRIYTDATAFETALSLACSRL